MQAFQQVVSRSFWARQKCDLGTQKDLSGQEEKER